MKRKFPFLNFRDYSLFVRAFFAGVAEDRKAGKILYVQQWLVYIFFGPIWVLACIPVLFMYDMDL